MNFLSLVLFLFFFFVFVSNSSVVFTFGAGARIKKFLTMFFVHVIAKEPPPLPDTSPNGSPGTKCSSTTTTTGTHRGCRQVDLHFGYPKGLDESFREADWGHATSSRKQVISAIARAPYYREAFTGQRAKIFHKSFKDMEIVLSSEGKDAVSKMGGQS